MQQKISTLLLVSILNHNRKMQKPEMKCEKYQCV